MLLNCAVNTVISRLLDKISKKEIRGKGHHQNTAVRKKERQLNNKKKTYF